MTIPLGVAARCFVIIGMPERLFLIAVIRLVTLVLATLGGFYLFNLQGVVWGITLSFFVSAPVTVFYPIKYGIFDLRRQLLAVLLVPVGVGEVVNLAIGR
jgi:hypothetical protein